LHASLHHRHLPPFPTRRSSDLTPLSFERATRAAVLPKVSQPSSRSTVATDVTFRAWGVGWRHMNVAVATEPLLERHEELAQIESDRKSTRLNSSHEWISYAVFC